MDANEMKTLEEKTRKIVETLNALEGELSSQRRANEDLAAERDRLRDVSSSLGEAAKSLRGVTELLKKSTFSKELSSIDEGLASLRRAGDEIDARIDALKSLERGLNDRIKVFENLKAEIEAIVDAKMAEGIAFLKSTEKSLDEKMEALSDFDLRMSERMTAFEHLRDEIVSSLDTRAAEAASANDSISAALAEIERVIGRIDRNTQKGIGKERG